MQKRKKIIKTILIIISIFLITFIIRTLILLAIITLTTISPPKTISGIENYDKNYYLKEYGNDLNSNLSIFPEHTTFFLEANFFSSLQTNLLDTDGYILFIIWF